MTDRWRSRQKEHGLRRGGVRRRGALLLEAMLALAIFVMAAAAVLTLVDGAREGMGRVRKDRHAADLARSAMAKLEAGLETPQTLNGPVKSWASETAETTVVSIGGDSSEAEGGWELHIETEPSQFKGLTSVTVRAFRPVAGDPERVEGAYTLRQLVRLGGKGEDRVGAEDELTEAAKRGAQDLSIRGRRGAPKEDDGGASRPGGRP